MVQPAVAPGMTVQNAKSIRYVIDGEMLARQGAMVAYRGNLKFERKGQGVGGMLKRAVTGEGLPVMKVHGQGEAWFAQEAQNVFVVDIEPGDVFTVNGRNVLCFDPTLTYEIKTVKGAGISGGGLFNSVFTGHGRLRTRLRGQSAGAAGLAAAARVRGHGRGRRVDRRSAYLAAPFAVARLDDPRRVRGSGATHAGGRGVRGRTAQRGEPAEAAAALRPCLQCSGTGPSGTGRTSTGAPAERESLRRSGPGAHACDPPGCRRAPPRPRPACTTSRPGCAASPAR